MAGFSADADTGLRLTSQVMVDKVVSVPRSSVSAAIGRCEARELEAVDGALRNWLAIE